MIAEKYMVRYTPSRLEEIEELSWSIVASSGDSISGTITVENGYIIITKEYDDEYARDGARARLKAIKGLIVIKDMAESTPSCFISNHKEVRYE